MALISPEQYKASLDDGRVVFYKGERVKNVATHPDLSVCVDLMAIDYAMAEDPAWQDLAVMKDPESGETLMELDPLEWVHRVLQHVPPRGFHTVRYFGAYSSRGRRTLGPGQGGDAGDAGDAGDGEAHPEEAPTAATAPGQGQEEPDTPFVIERRREWARLIKKVFEVDPLECPRCSGPMKVISVITDQEAPANMLRQVESLGVTIMQVES